VEIALQVETMASKVGAALTCAGRIVDPVCDAVFGSSSGGMLTSLVSWSHNKRNQTITQRALGELHFKWMKTEWSQQKFIEDATTGYTNVFHGITSGQMSKVKPLTTEPTFILIKRGIQDGVAEVGYRQGSTIIQNLLPPVIAQARLVHLKPLATRMADQRPDFVQVTVTHTTLQQPSAALSVKEDKVKRRSEDGYISEGEAETAPRSALGTDFEMAGEWTPVMHASLGLVYWYNSATGATTWKKPLPAQLVPRIPFRIESCGRTREPITDSAAAANSPLPHVKVIHNVVWERSLREGTPATWRIAKL
jgi:hypothetical protein